MFLNPRLRDWLPDPSHLHDLDRAAERLARAVPAGERVGLIGDYDVDGATATALMARYLRSLGVAVEIEIPDRMRDGYGPNARVLDRAGRPRLPAGGDARHRHHRLRASGPCRRARARGDRRRPPRRRGGAARRPWRWSTPTGSTRTSPLKHLAAVGVTFVVLVAVTRALRERGAFAARPEPPLLQLARSRGPRHGLRRGPAHRPQPRLRPSGAQGGPRAGNRRASPRWRRPPGSPRSPTPASSASSLGPRINAGGRIGQSDLGARLLDHRCRRRGGQLARPAARAQRRAPGDRARRCSRRRSARSSRSSGAGCRCCWRPAPAGIRASSASSPAGLVERHHRPVVVLGLADGIAKGSARSIRGFDLGAAVIAARQQGLLQQGGGHGMAAGMTLAEADLERFHRFLLDAVRGRDRRAACRQPAPLELDGALSVGAARPGLAQQIAAAGALRRRQRRAALRPHRRAGDAGPDRRRRPCQLRAHRRRRTAASRPSPFAAPPRRSAASCWRAACRCGSPAGSGSTRWQGREQACFEIEDAAPAGATP